MIDSAHIRLKDIADVQASDPSLSTKLGSLDVGSLPADGLRRVMQRGQVLATIQKLDRDVRITANGASQIMIERRTSGYPAATLIDTVREHLSRQLRRDHPSLTRIEIVPVGEFPELRAPGGRIDVTPRMQATRRLAQRFCVWLDVQVDGKPYRTLPVWVNVQAYAPVLVARRSLVPRERIGVDDVSREERNIAGFSGTALADFSDVANQRTRLYIPAGKMLKTADVEPSPVVLATQEVNVRVVAGSVEIETKAVAEEEGHVGEYIRVRNPSSAAIFMAQVVGDRSVQVTER